MDPTSPFRRQHGPAHSLPLDIHPPDCERVNVCCLSPWGCRTVTAAPWPAHAHWLSPCPLSHVYQNVGTENLWDVGVQAQTLLLESQILGLLRTKRESSPDLQPAQVSKA